MELYTIEYKPDNCNVELLYKNLIIGGAELHIYDDLKFIKLESLWVEQQFNGIGL